MRYQPVQRRTVEIIGFQRFINDVRKLGHRDFKYFVTRHRQMNRVFWVHAIGVRQRQQFAIATVSVQMRGENAWLFRCAQYNRARPITENDDRSAIGWITGARQNIRANDQSMLNCARFNILVGNAQGVSETSASGCNVKRRTAFDPQHTLDLARRAWKCVSG